MPNLTADQIITKSTNAICAVQGAAGNPGLRGQDTIPRDPGRRRARVGRVDPIWNPDPRRVGQYTLVGQITPPDLASATLLMPRAPLANPAPARQNRLSV